MTYVENIKSTQLKYLYVLHIMASLSLLFYLGGQILHLVLKMLRLLSNFCYQFYSINQLHYCFFALRGFFLAYGSLQSFVPSNATKNNLHLLPQL